MAEFMSYKQVLDGVINADDIEPLISLVEQHKNWGAFNCRVPSYIIVRLIDAVQTLRTAGAEYYETDAEEEGTDAEGDTDEEGAEI